MPTTSIPRQAELFRGRVLAREARVRRQMRQAWQDIEDSLEYEARALLVRVDDLSPDQLRRLRRYRVFQEQARARVREYARVSHAKTAELTDWATHYGLEAGETLAGAVGVTLSQPSEEAVRAIVGRVRARSVKRVFEGFADEVVRAVEREIITGIGAGRGPREIARRVRKVSGLPRWQAERLARTEALSAYRAANIAVYAENTDVVSGWIWSATYDDRTCPICWGMDGTRFPPGASFDSHPQCRCAPLPVTKTWQEMGYDIEDSRIYAEPGERFGKLGYERQREILGPSRHDAYVKGTPLSAMIATTDHPVWGGGRRLRAVTSL